MSDQILRLIPVDPDFIPDEHAQQSALDCMTAWLPSADVVNGTASDEVNFVDPGMNLVQIFCPACGTPLDMGDWQAMMDTAFISQFADLTVTMPCCGAVGSLNDLHYDWPAGFARYVLESLNPNGDLDDVQINELAHILGCPVRKIWAEY
ncbi:MAG: hypothetical protein K8I30_09055 [Anaerolineae bacterium]|nr:hypothetical protein [Anaerolineae bacterium]